MKRITRREFARAVAGAAVMVPIAGPEVAAALRPSLQSQQQQEAPKSEAKPKYGMTKEQEERVKQAMERRERQSAPMRAKTLAYEQEPAFVFQVQPRTKPQRGGEKRR